MRPYSNLISGLSYKARFALPTLFRPHCTLFMSLLCLSQYAGAAGVSPYLPLNMSPEIEYKVEQLMVIAGKSVMARPIPLSEVVDALKIAQHRNPQLTRQIRAYLERYKKTAGVTHWSIEAGNADDTDKVIPNNRGRTTDSYYHGSVVAYWQPSEWVIVNVGAIAWEDNEYLDNSYLSIGHEYFQIDVGYRAHWWSPFQDSAMIWSTQAETIPSITISNVRPISDFGFRYETFYGELSSSERIRSGGGFTSGDPKIFGLHLSIEPFDGWSLGFNRIMQYGGGSRDSDFTDLLEAFFDPSGKDNTGSGLSSDEEFGNQISSVTSRVVFPGQFPMAVYMEYAGEDTSKSSNFRLGNTSLMLGVHMPKLTEEIDFTYEFADWQNAWYTHGIYQDGLTNEGNSVGHWFGDERSDGEAPGGTSHMLKVVWHINEQQLLDAKVRYLSNEDYTSTDYDDGIDLTLRYTYAMSKFFVGGQLYGGQDVFGEDFVQVTGFLRW